MLDGDGTGLAVGNSRADFKRQVLGVLKKVNGGQLQMVLIKTIEKVLYLKMVMVEHIIWMLLFGKVILGTVTKHLMIGTLLQGQYKV